MIENVGFRIYDRNEHTFAPGAPISPPPIIPPGKLLWEVNIIGLYSAERPPDPPIFTDNVTVATAGSGQTFYSGYTRIDLGFNGQGRDNTANEPLAFNFFRNFFFSYNGLPAIGIVMTEFFNDSVNGYYGNTVPWQYSVDWCTTNTCALGPYIN